MTSDSVQDSTRYVVSDVHQGSIMPGRRAEMWRDVFLQSGADIRGAIWCGSLSITGPDVQVAQSVYCRGAATVDGVPGEDGANGTVTFGSCFTSPDSLVVGNVPFKVRFLSDIYSNQINISNSFVYGNVFANSAIIRDSVVLGGIFCQESVTVERSFVSTFQADTVHLGEGTSMFFPYGIAREEITLAEAVRVFTFYSLYKQLAGNGERGETVHLDENDVVVLTVPGEQMEGQADERQAQVYCLSMTERILDSVPVYEHLSYNREFLQQLALGSNLEPSAKGALFDHPLGELEKELWELATVDQTEARRQRGTSINELFERVARASRIESPDA